MLISLHVTLDGVQPPNTKITRPPDAANFQSEASTDEFKDEKFSKSYAGTGKLYLVYENCQIMHS